MARWQARPPTKRESHRMEGSEAGRDERRAGRRKPAPGIGGDPVSSSYGGRRGPSTSSTPSTVRRGRTNRGRLEVLGSDSMHAQSAGRAEPSTGCKASRGAAAGTWDRDASVTS